MALVETKQRANNLVLICTTDGPRRNQMATPRIPWFQIREHDHPCVNQFFCVTPPDDHNGRQRGAMAASSAALNTILHCSTRGRLARVSMVLAVCLLVYEKGEPSPIEATSRNHFPLHDECSMVLSAVDSNPGMLSPTDAKPDGKTNLERWANFKQQPDAAVILRSFRIVS